MRFLAKLFREGILLPIAFNQVGASKKEIKEYYRIKDAKRGKHE